MPTATAAAKEYQMYVNGRWVKSKETIGVVNPAIEEVFARLCGNEVMARTVPEGYPTSGLAVIDAIGEDAYALRDFLVG